MWKAIFCWILGLIWAGSLYVSNEYVIGTIYWLQMIAVIIIFSMAAIMISKFANLIIGFSEFRSNALISKKYIVWVVIFPIFVFVGLQFAIWRTDYFKTEFRSNAEFISKHVEFPWNGNMPRFYIGDKPTAKDLRSDNSTQ